MKQVSDTDTLLTMFESSYLSLFTDEEELKIKQWFSYNDNFYFNVKFEKLQ